MKTKIRLSFLFACFLLLSQAQSRQYLPWTGNPFEQKAFVENKGQFDGKCGDRKILYGASSGGVDIYFAAGTIIYRHDSEIHPKQPEKERSAPIVVPGSLAIEWVGANPDAAIVAEDKASFYYTYGHQQGQQVSTIKAAAYSRVVYKDLYPHIDVEYILPEKKIGIKYSLVLHPGADVSVIKMRYQDAQGIKLSAGGDLLIKSSFGEFIDHAPETFFSDNKKKVASGFRLDGNSVSFITAAQSVSRTLVIDPWTSNPNFVTWNAAYDVNFDNNGNVLAYGSYNPLKLAKFDNTGALQWIYNMTGGAYAYGDFAVDEGTGISYIGEGKGGFSGVHKVSAAGTLITIASGVMGEIWRMEFNRNTNDIEIGGGSGPNFAAVMDTSLSYTAVTLGTNDDMVLLTVDDCGTNICYMASCGANNMWMLPGSTLIPVTFQVNDGYTFSEVGSVKYVGGYNVSFAANGFNGMSVSSNWLYTYNGQTLKKWNKNTGAFVTSINVAGTPYKHGGLSADDCDNVFVGVGTAINEYNSSLSFTASYPLPDTVYDIKLGKTNVIYACGKGFAAQVDLPSPVTMSQSSANCNQCNGTATATLSGSCFNATYLWSPGGQTTQTATALCAGSYTVTVSNGCSATYTGSVTVTASTTLSASASQQDVLCNGQQTGSATVTLSGGTSPFTYLWSNGQTTNPATGLGAGTYTVTVTDLNGCTATLTVAITQPAQALSGNVSSTNSQCSGNTGTATISASGGVSGYTYLWNNGQTGQTATGLGQGTYTVTVTDANGCTMTQTVYVNCTTLSAQIQGLCTKMCLGGCQSVQAVVSGGSSPYTYIWTPNIGNGPGPYSVCPTTTTSYTLIVIDQNGDTVNGGSCLVTIWPIYTGVNVNTTQPGCAGGTGTATANPNGATAPFTYSWSNGLTTQTATGLASGTYTVTVTDANGCTATQTVTIIQPSPLTASASSFAVCGANNGTATASASGGTTPYSYSWSGGGGTNANATGLSSGTYTCTITDASNCTQTVTVNVIVNANPNASATPPISTITLGGSATLNASGGGTYLWSSGQTGSSITVSPAATTVYCVVVTNANNCTDSACVTVIVDQPTCSSSLLSTLMPTAFSPNGDGTNDALCLPASVCIRTFVLKIYDRWGEKLFETTQFSSCWDGTYKGKPLNSSVFAYYFEAELITGETFSQKGNISLLR